MKPHIKVIQRNGVDVFVTSSMKMKKVNRRYNKYNELNINHPSRFMNCSYLDSYMHNAALTRNTLSGLSGLVKGA